MSDLFRKQKLSDYFDDVNSAITREINNLSENQILSLPEDEIISHVVSQYEIIPLEIYQDSMSAEQEDTKIQYENGSPYYDGINFHTQLPFNGDSCLWYMRPSSYTLTFPEGSVQTNKAGVQVLTFDLVVALDQPPETHNKLIERQIESIKSFIERQKKDIETFNKTIESTAKIAINIRKKKLEKKSNIIKAFNIPLIKSPNAPDMSLIPIKRKLVKPLPLIPNKPTEYAVADEDYEHILSVIRHVGATFETTRKTYEKHDEEELRDIILAHLNGHYQGDATGETFRGSGKTDIKIEFENRAAFVGECKVWRGEKEILEAIDQLMGYLTWRDCKTAIVIFNKYNKEFYAIQEKIPAIFQGHENYLNIYSGRNAGEWRFELKSKEDKERHVLIHVFLFNLYVK
ncbi:MAG: hypothetical protein NTX52_13565 [Planctomycetota bacterium]|nr:hypothetical protein [Planctomycetota bacterium]